MAPDSPPTSNLRRYRRRWERKPAVCTVLAQLPGDESLGKTVDFSDFGLGVLLQGRGCRPGEAIRLSVVFRLAVQRFRGVVAHVRSAGRWTRVGVRLARPGAHPLLHADGLDGYGAFDVPPRANGANGNGSGANPIRVNLGLRFNLLSIADQRVLAANAEHTAEVLRRARVATENGWQDGLLEFLERFPTSPERWRILRELFRSAMRTDYPRFPGTVIRGHIRLASAAGESANPGRCVVYVDRFAVAESDEEGAFLAEGLPILEEPVVVPIWVKGRDRSMEGPVVVRLPPRREAEVEVDLPVIATVDPERTNRGLRRGRGAEGRRASPRGPGVRLF